MKKIKTFTSLILILLMSTFALQAQNSGKQQQSQARKYIKVEVKGLACPFCAYGLEKKLKKVEGAEEVYVSLENGFATFSVPVDKTPSEENLKKLVANAGFEAGKITFSDKPFSTEGKD